LKRRTNSSTLEDVFLRLTGRNTAQIDEGSLQ
jgi:hypothetical protein